MMKWDDLKDVEPGYYIVDTSTIPAEFPREEYRVAWLVEEQGTKGVPILALIIKIVGGIAFGIIAYYILVRINELAATVLRVNITVQAKDDQGRPTLLTDDRGNVYTVGYDDQGYGFVKDKANPNEWIVNLGIVVAVIVVAAALTLIAYKILGSPRPATRLVPYSPPPIPSVPPPPPPPPPSPPPPAKVPPPPVTAKVPS